MIHDIKDRPWLALDLLPQHRATQPLRLQRFGLWLALPHCLVLAVLVVLRAMLSDPPRPLSSAQPSPQVQYDVVWAQRWQANRAHASEILTLLSQQTPADLRLISLKQEAGQLTLTGQASRKEALLQFEQILKTQAGYRYSLRKDTSAGLYQIHPIQHFILVLAKTEPADQAEAP